MGDVRWIKLMVGAFDGSSFKKIKKATLKDGTSYRDKLTAVWFELLDLAAKKNLQGQLCNTEDLEIPFTSEAQFEDIAIMIDRQPEEVECCISWFVKNKMVVIVDDIYMLANWEKYQAEDKLAQIREQNRIRNIAYRARKKELPNVTNCDNDVIVTSRDALDKEIDKEIDKDIDINNINNTILSVPDKNNKTRQEIFNHWISKKSLIQHKTLTDNIAKAIDKALKIYDVRTICLAINRYDVMLRSTYWLNYKWSLEDFLSQKNALPDFLDDGSKWVTFRDEAEKNPLILPKEERPEASPKDVPVALKKFYDQI